jgi:multiple sugar transport system substrate-binding protein
MAAPPSLYLKELLAALNSGSFQAALLSGFLVLLFQEISGYFHRIAESAAETLVPEFQGSLFLFPRLWKKAIETYQQLKNIPGIQDGKAAIPSFEKDQNLAMLAGLGARLGELEQIHNEGKPMNWDMAAMPTFPEKAGNAFRTSLFLLMVNSTGKHQEEAFRVIDVLTSDEVQTALNKRGRLTSLKDAKFRQSFGESLSSMKGKNKDAIFKNAAAPVPPITLYDGIGRSNVISAGDKVINNKADVNTALREAEDSANKRIEEEKKK